jgi:hypothetical protein
VAVEAGIRIAVAVVVVAEALVAAVGSVRKNAAFPESETTTRGIALIAMKVRSLTTRIDFR